MLIEIVYSQKALDLVLNRNVAHSEAEVKTVAIMIAICPTIVNTCATKTVSARW